MRWGHVARMAEMRNVHKILDLKEIGCECVDLIHLAKDMDQWRALVNTVMNLRVP
jgi:hypothetical protein